MRSVQYFVANELFKILRSQNVYDIIDLMRLEKSIDKKVKFLRDEYSMYFPDFLIDSYIGFLWIHLLTKGAYKGEPVTVSLSDFVRERLVEYHNSLAAFLTKKSGH